jgi:Flp pilus assembly protein TadD
MERYDCRMKAVLLALCLVVAGCAHRPVGPVPETLFSDHLFAPPAEPVRVQDVFALSDEMRRYVEAEMAEPLRIKGMHRGLLDALYSRHGLRLDYDAAVTRNASQAFEARSGNCLSLVIMTAAFAKALGLTVEYQSAFVEPVWSRAGGMHFLSGHVNLKLGGRSTGTGTRTLFDAGELMIVDFLPPGELRGMRTWPIGENTVVAMYMNNRAAESLARGRVDDAYWWARSAIGQDAEFLSAYNTLGVVYLRHGAWAQAERVLAHVLAHEPENPQALSNLALVLEKAGRADEAGQLQRKLAKIEPYPAFHFLDRGLAALRLGQLETARSLLAREVDRAPYDHESHFWLGVVNLRLGNLREARRNLTIALENSTTRGDRELYGAKLERIRSRAP